LAVCDLFGMTNSSFAGSIAKETPANYRRSEPPMRNQRGTCAGSDLTRPYWNVSHPGVLCGEVYARRP
jgi:hypothetical protein